MHDNLSHIEALLSRVKGFYDLIIYDADGTLRRCTVPEQVCPFRHGEWELMPGVVEVVRTIHQNRSGTIEFGIVSNQAPVGKGLIKHAVARQLLVDLAVAAFGMGPIEGMVQFCPHLRSAGCECRKPKPAMLEWAMRINGTSKIHTLYVGDMESDQEAAHAAGCHFMWAWDFFGRGRAEWEAEREVRSVRLVTSEL
jgi:D-glycero-D-manno-heptose 1,7-bisphosphate phosphatase